MTQRVIITGAAHGIGRAIALACGGLGWGVVALDIDEEGASQSAEDARAAGAPDFLGLRCDVRDEDSVREAFDCTFDTFGTVDGVVANAGVEVNAPLHLMPVDTWDRVIATNLTGVFLTCKYAIAHLLRLGRPGSIVCTSSPAAFVGFAGGGNGAYGASKGGISAFVRSAALDYAASGIRVNGLVPGATATDLLHAGSPDDDARYSSSDLELAAHEQIPLGRLAQPEEIAAAATWLLSDDSSYVTGSNLVCDGGLLAKSANNF